MVLYLYDSGHTKTFKTKKAFLNRRSISFPVTHCKAQHHSNFNLTFPEALCSTVQHKGYGGVH